VSTLRTGSKGSSVANVVQSLERGLVALEATIRAGRIKPSAIAEELHVDRSTAYRLLFTLTEKGYLVQDPATRDFLPNPVRFFGLIGAMGEPMDWPTRAADFLRQLRDRSGETSNLGAIDEREVVYLAQQRALDGLMVSNPVGTRRPWHCSALGKAILAHLSDQEIDALVGGKPLVKHTFRTITDLQTFKRHLAIIRERGYATDDEETFIGVRCVASPIFDHTGHVMASIGVSGPSVRLTPERILQLAETVCDVAGQASKFFGASRQPGDTQHANTLPSLAAASELQP
jgi:IclR family transcriptional regulator, KDG regulon repressor